MRMILTLEVPNVKVAVDFYCQKLGLFICRGTAQGESDTQITILDDTEFEVLRIHLVKIDHETNTWTSEVVGELFRLPIKTESFNEAHSYLKNRNLTIHRYDTPPFCFQFLLADPFGNRFYLVHTYELGYQKEPEEQPDSRLSPGLSQRIFNAIWEINSK